VRRRSGMGIIGLVDRIGTDIHRTPRQARAVPCAVLVLVLSAGCGGDRERDDGSVDARADSTLIDPAAGSADPGTGAADAGAGFDDPGTGDAPADERADGPGAVMGAEWTAGDTNVERSVEGAALLRAVRTAGHDGFDRIVLDFGNDAVPGYRIAYIDRPVRQCGSGNEVPFAGDAWLSIAAEPAAAHTEAGEPTVRERERAPGLPVLLELKLICDFEAQVEVVAGVASPGRYRAFVLDSPGRLVIDIMHPPVRGN
jgi:hypothetical protein